MNFSTIDMYWLVKLDDIRGFIMDISFVTGLFLLVGGLAVFTYIIGEDQHQHFKKAVVTSSCMLILIFSMLFAFAIIPSTKQMAAILVLPKIVNNQHVQEMPNKILELSTAWLEELKPKNKQ